MSWQCGFHHYRLFHCAPIIGGQILFIPKWWQNPSWLQRWPHKEWLSPSKRVLIGTGTQINMPWFDSTEPNVWWENPEKQFWKVWFSFKQITLTTLYEIPFVTIWHGNKQTQLETTSLFFLSFKITVLTDPSTAGSRNGEVGAYFTIISFDKYSFEHHDITPCWLHLQMQCPFRPFLTGSIIVAPRP